MAMPDRGTTVGQQYVTASAGSEARGGLNPCKKPNQHMALPGPLSLRTPELC